MDNQYTCINDVFTIQQRALFKELPIKDQDYTFKEEVKSAIDGKIGYIFYELHNPSHPNGQEFSFRPSRFVKKDKSINKIDKILENEFA